MNDYLKTDASDSRNLMHQKANTGMVISEEEIHEKVKALINERILIRNVKQHSFYMKMLKEFFQDTLNFKVKIVLELNKHAGKSHHYYFPDIDFQSDDYYFTAKGIHCEDYHDWTIKFLNYLIPELICRFQIKRKS